MKEVNRTLVGCGAAGAIAAAFNAPLTGAFYAFELIIGTYTIVTLTPVVVAALDSTSAMIGAPRSVDREGAAWLRDPCHVRLPLLGGSSLFDALLDWRQAARGCDHRLGHRGDTLLHDDLPVRRRQHIAP